MSEPLDAIAELRAEVVALSAQVRLLTDRAEIDELVDRYVTSMDRLDADGFDPEWAVSLFTDDVVLEYPPGTHERLDGAGRFHAEVMGRFGATWHLSGNHLVELDSDAARVRVTLTATHLYAGAAGRQGDDDSFVVGDHFDVDVVRTPRGWRIRQMTLHVVWTRGRPPLGNAIAS